MPEPERTALYRHFGADGELLYIGISKDPDGRWADHRANPKPWVHRAARRIDEWYDSRPEALAAEEAAIRAERPGHNGTHNYDAAPFTAETWPTVTGGRGSSVTYLTSLLRDEISCGRWRVGMRLPSLATIAEATGVSPRTVSLAMSRLQRAGLVAFRSGRGLFVRRPVTLHDPTQSSM